MFIIIYRDVLHLEVQEEYKSLEQALEAIQEVKSLGAFDIELKQYWKGYIMFIKFYYVVEIDYSDAVVFTESVCEKLQGCTTHEVHGLYRYKGITMYDKVLQIDVYYNSEQEPEVREVINLFQQHMREAGQVSCMYVINNIPYILSLWLSFWLYL